MFIYNIYRRLLQQLSMLRRYHQYKRQSLYVTSSEGRMPRVISGSDRPTGNISLREGWLQCVGFPVWLTQLAVVQTLRIIRKTLGKYSARRQTDRLREKSCLADTQSKDICGIDCYSSPQNPFEWNFFLVLVGLETWSTSHMFL